MSARHLIVVPGHGVCRAGCSSPRDAALDESWIGIFPGEAPLYVEHLHAGVVAAAGSDAVLVCSGGQTREAAGARSEAESHVEIARDANWWGHPAVGQRIRREDYARDSFENLIFALAAFLGDEAAPPDHLTVVGWQFKAQRFGLHRHALAWPEDRFTYVGVNNPRGEALAKAEGGERAKVEAVRRDPFLSGPEWHAQRSARDPFRRGHPYRGIDSRLDDIFDRMEGKPGPIGSRW